MLLGIGLYQSVKDTSCDVEILVKDSKDAWSTVLNHSGTLKKSQSTNQTNRYSCMKRVLNFVVLSASDFRDVNAMNKPQ